MERFDRFWIGAAAVSFAFFFAGLFALVALRHDDGPPLLVVDAPAKLEWAGDIYIGGEVANPGLYPFKRDDTLEGLVSAAGGTSDQVDPERLSLIVRATDPDRAQRVDLNRADAWLLETLPGIGPRTASAIIDYRNKNGPFRMVNDLLNVPGIGDATMVRLSEYVTVGE